MAIDRDDITGVVLAGGRGVRMGNVDKGLLDCGGRPLAARTLGRLAPQVHTLLLSANRNIERYAALGARVVADAWPGHAGPLAGLHAALAIATTPYVVTAPCDSPALPLDLVARLAAALDASHGTLAVAHTGGRSEPAFALVHVSLGPQLDRYLASGERKVEGWQRSVGATTVAFDDQRAAFANLNTPAELAAFACTLAGTHTTTPNG